MLKRSLTIDWGGRKALILFVWTLCLHSHAASKCAFSIISSNLRDSVLVAEEESTVSLNFTLDGNCNFPDKFWIIVARMQKAKTENQTAVFGDICTIRNSKGSCKSLTSNTCRCSKRKGEYILRKTVDQNDNTTWLWRTDPKVADMKNVEFVVSETKTYDSLGRVTNSKTDSTVSVHTGSSRNSVQPDSKRGDSVTAVTENNVAASLRTGSSRVSAVYVVTVTNNVSGDPVPFLFGVDFMVVASVGIVALAITISIACMRRGRRSEEHIRPSALAQFEPVNPLDVLRPQVNEADEDNENRRFSQESNFYWEVRDDPPTPSPELPRPCLWPALSEDYLHPSVSHVVMEGTDDAAKATPLYENSTLRQVDTAGLGGETARSFARGTNSTDSSLVVSSDTVAACSLEPSRHDDDENEEDEDEDRTEDPESGYMPMTGTVHRITTAASEPSMEVTDGTEASNMHYENNTAI